MPDHFHSLRWSVLAIFTFFLFCGCHLAAKNQSLSLGEKTAPIDVFNLRLSKSGDSTAVIAGYTLTNAGDIIYWQQYPGKPESVLEKIRIEPAATNRYRKELLDLELLETKIENPGNFTYRIVYSTDSTSYSWVWNAHSEIIMEYRSLFDWFNRTWKFAEKNQQ